MKRTLFLSGILTSLLLGGCGVSNGVGLGKQEVTKKFSQGTITRSEKVLVDKSMIATVTGAGVGAVGGALIGAKESGGDAVKGGLIGAVVGAGIGYVGGYLANGGEMEAYEVDVKDSKTGELHEAYLEKELNIGTNVEFVKRDGVITNINVITKK